MNVNSNPLPAWTTPAAVVAAFLCYGALDALDAHTEALIARADADAAQAAAQVVQQYGIECGEPVEMPAFVGMVAETQP